MAKLSTYSVVRLMTCVDGHEDTKILASGKSRAHAKMLLDTLRSVGWHRYIMVRDTKITSK